MVINSHVPIRRRGRERAARARGEKQIYTCDKCVPVDGQIAGSIRSVFRSFIKSKMLETDLRVAVIISVVNGIALGSKTLT